jgi:pimeloyl-ACP methyl ester carboxylesterase
MKFFSRVMAWMLCAAMFFGVMCSSAVPAALAAENQEQDFSYSELAGDSNAGASNGFEDLISLDEESDAEIFSTHEAPINADSFDTAEDVGLGRIYDSAVGLRPDEMMIGDRVYPLVEPIDESVLGALGEFGTGTSFGSDVSNALTKVPVPIDYDEDSLSASFSDSSFAVTGQILAINADDDWSYGIIHEIGHDFDDARWNFDAEFFANLKVSYVVDTNTSARVWTGRINSVPYINYANLPAFYKTYAPGAYDNTVATGTYHNDGLNYTFLKIKNQIGWNPFKQTFRYFNSLPAADVPTTNLGKLNLFLSKLMDYSGYNVFSLLTAQEKNVYQTRFGGTIEYTDNKITLVLIAGIMGSRLYYDEERKWDPPLDEFGDFIDVINFGTQYKPYLMSNENGEPDFMLDTVGDDSAYGAMNKYQAICQFLDSSANFPKSNYIFKFFTYDWRLSSVENADKLAEFIASDNKVVLIAHSMGGLVASAYLAKGVAYRNKVDKMITLGTPYTGAAKAISGFEVGDITGTIADLFLESHMKEICANTTSVYELLPTSRYGASYVNIPSEIYASSSTPVDLTHSQAQTFFANNRPWAIKANGIAKPMLSDSEAFHNGLLLSGSHIANSVDTYYIAGSDRSTPAKAVYENLFSNDPYFLSYFEAGIGDGTVLESSAANRNSIFKTFPVKHLELVENQSVREYMKDIILGTSSQTSSSNFSATSLALSEISTSWENTGNYLTVVLQGVTDFIIYDSDGNELMQNGDSLYIENTDGTHSKKGCVWIINYETMRYQYVLKPDSYTFESMETDSSIIADTIVMSFENWLYQAKTRFSDFSGADNVTLSASAETCNMIEDGTLEEISPISVSSILELQELNKTK